MDVPGQLALLFLLFTIIEICRTTSFNGNELRSKQITKLRPSSLSKYILDELSTVKIAREELSAKIKHFQAGFDGKRPNVRDLIAVLEESEHRLNGFVNNANKTKELVSKGCINAIHGILLRATKNDSAELLRMLDADGKPGSGIFEGGNVWLGSFQECKKTNYAHYCLAQLNILAVPLKLGLCVPKECSQEDVLIILKVLASITEKVIKRPVFQVAVNGSMAKSFGSPVFCDEPTSYSAGNIAAICVAALFGFLVLVGTILDYTRTCFEPKKVVLSKSNGFMPIKTTDDVGLTSHAPVNENQPFLAQGDVKRSHGDLCLDILLCFSFQKNASQIFETEVPSSAITCLNGIRTLSMFWVILGHTFFFALYSEPDNIVEAFSVVHRLSFQAIANAYFSVDTFFMLSGLLVAYLCLKRFDKYNGVSFFGYFGKKFLPQFYIHRFLRLTPSYMFVILFYIYIFPLCGRGPFWFEQARGDGIENCKKYWWTNLFYINNFYPNSMGTECIGWSWYLANDMQFYLISPLILIVMFKFRLIGTVIVNTFICVASFLATACIIGIFNLNSLLTGDFQEAAATQETEFADWVYSKPYSRISPYLVGLTLGYLLYKRKEPRRGTKTIVGFTGWTISVAVALVATYGPYTAFRDGGTPFNLVENILYGTFTRFSWAVCVAWVVYACKFGMGGFVNSLLSWKAFIPLSRLTYSAYLVHPIVIYVFYTSLEAPFHYTDISIVYYYASFLLLTYGSAFLLSVLIEFPALNLEKLSFRF